jgi:DUF4097 and DUF4098 domain-containing protein YvlB
MRAFRASFVLPCLLASATPSGASWDCDVKEPRHAVLDAEGATTLRVIARAGSLTITGDEGASRVEASGMACADSQKNLEKVVLKAERAGEEVRLEVLTPKGWSASAGLDLTVTAPRRLGLVVEDGSGEAEIRGVQSLRLEDGSGGIEVVDVEGNVDIRDGSGEIELRGVGGDVEIHDGSGEIEVERVSGSVVVEDGSGSVEVEHVTGSVTIEEDGSGEIRIESVERDVRVRRDGSGGIRVSDVGGDFTVERDGSGSIDHSGVEGRISVPSR